MTSAHETEAQQHRWEKEQRDFLALLLRNGDLLKRFYDTDGGQSEWLEHPFNVIAEIMRTYVEKYGLPVKGSPDDMVIGRKSFINAMVDKVVKKRELAAAESQFNRMSFIHTDRNNYAHYFECVKRIHLFRELKNTRTLFNAKLQSKAIEPKAALQYWKDQLRLYKDAKESTAALETQLRNIQRYIGVPSPFKSDIIKMSDIQMKPIVWLLQDRIPLGNLSVIYGDGGCGKSHITLDLAARVSTGTLWAGDTPVEQGGVLLITGEDSLADTVKPRLVAAGANVNNIGVVSLVTEEDEKGQPVKTPFSLNHIPQLEHELKAFRKTFGIMPKLVVIDPITSFLAGADSHKDAEVRRVLTPLAKVAESCGVAIVCVAHINKQRGGRAAHRLSGSAGFGNAARAMFFVGINENDGTRIMAHVKHNASKPQPSLSYEIEETTLDEAGTPIPTSKLTWVGQTDLTADDALASADESKTSTKKAAKWLKTVLTNGEMLSADVLVMGEQEGYSKQVVYDAAKQAGIKSFKEAGKWNGRWKMKLDQTYEISNIVRSERQQNDVSDGDPLGAF